MAQSDQKKKELELEPDAWARFERAVDIVAKSPPQHKTKQSKVSEDGAPRAKAKPSKAGR
jgi:hypothetical protein